MGCGDSKSELVEFKGRLVHIDNVMSKAPWRGPAGSLQRLKAVAEEIRDVYVFFVDTRSGQHTAEVERVHVFRETLVLEVLDCLDKELVKRGNIARFQELLVVSREVDKFNSTSVTFILEDKYRELQTEISMESINQIGSTVRRMSSPEHVGSTLKQVTSILQRAQSNLEDVKDCIPRVLEILREFGAQITDRVVDLESLRFNEVHANLGKLDNSCTRLAKVVDQDWTLIAPQVKHMRRMQLAAVLPPKLDAIEAMLAKSSGMNHMSLIAAFADLVDSWDPEIEEFEKQLQGFCSTVTSRVLDAFDSSLTSGASGKLNAMEGFASGYDSVIKQLQQKGGAVSQPSLSLELKKKRAGVNLATMLSRAKHNIADSTIKLDAARTEAEAKIAKVPPESSHTPGAGAWKYSLRRGAFKPYDPETSANFEECYQRWVAGGRSTDKDQRRFELVILVDGGRVSTARKSLPRHRRERCKYGETCFRKNPEHRNEFSHPGDDDWAAEVMTNDVLEESSTTVEKLVKERFSADFALMTILNLDRGGRMRKIERVEGLTPVQKITQEYFGQVIEFVKGLNTIFSQAELDLRLLSGDPVAEVIETDVKSLLEDIGPAVRGFLELAVRARDAKAIDEIVALLGEHSEVLGIGELLKKIRLRDVVKELEGAYEVQKMRNSLSRWVGVRTLVLNHILKARLALVRTVEEFRTLSRRQVQMRYQALLSEFADDDAFCGELRGEASVILGRVLQGMADAEFFEPEVVSGILRTAFGWQCDMGPLLTLAGELVIRTVRGACRSKLQPLTRVIEVFDSGVALTKVAHRPPKDLGDFGGIIPLLGERAFDEASVVRDKGRPCSETSLKNVVALRTRLVQLGPALRTESELGAHQFDEELWKHFQPWYTDLVKASSSEVETAVEWAIAYCEQSALALPSWMMNKNQVDALRKLQAALASQAEKELREAAIFAKQADLKSDANLTKLYEECVNKLKCLKRLPSGWEVTDLVGDDASTKMFKQVDLNDVALKAIFQRLFDDTWASIVTRDRVGAVPRGFRVERIVSVMNAESWVSYLQRRDAITVQCGRFAGSAPISGEAWDAMSGVVATRRGTDGILLSCNMPPVVESANEFLMFHGTKPDAADSIAQNHFDMAFACKTGMFGAGLYFAESISKSDEYVKPSTTNQYPVILARVTLGRINYCPELDPIKNPGRAALERSCLCGDYHSVLGDRKKARGTYREFVVYDHFQVYPQFIIWYSRS
eukprot:TRINITY_DN21428_c0_g3_i1.p1 TRINITY_DN21428_c0_g3~~TRINITY_DN21428_c0_g3_i1.p1  ORF type:complete len:1240 (+),score=181.34 TRINITY_DN21428_c0_g3_i1:201-3920(+)